ncbi:MAG: four helix bundle protein [bacterium]|nr:four helix bundle protein [bacterium]
MLTEDLDVFKLAHELVLDIYDITKIFPYSQQNILISQMQKAAISIPANLIEGAGRLYEKEYKRFISISSGSCSEIIYYILLSKDLNYITKDQFDILDKKARQIKKMLFGVLKQLKG